jgi:cysteine desulfurase
MELGKIYLDNAATTPLHPEVIDEMTQVLTEVYGNPSATHAVGRQAKGLMETCRKNIACFINAHPSEIVFTSGGTEADNMALRCAVDDLKVKHIITTPIEHKAVLDTAQHLEKLGRVKCHLLKVDDKGRVDLDQLRSLMEELPNGIVSIMHANNEIGTINPIKEIALMCGESGFYMHSDTVQTMAHLPIDVKDLGVDFLTCSAHKFHGPKGCGFLYKRQGLSLKPMITGGAQESQHRAGTENIAGIAGMHKAMAIAIADMNEEEKRIQGLKESLWEGIRQIEPDAEILGEEPGELSLYTVLNVGLPVDKSDMILFKLDLQGICISGGSACNSGSDQGSHVVKGIGKTDIQPVRFSFGRFTTEDEIKKALAVLKEVLS